jgi:hypothetical protein
MKLKIYIVTYRDPVALDANLASLFASDLHGQSPQVSIINNHSKFRMLNHYPVEVLHNTLRPDRSTGNLVENWNQALTLGFGDLEDPDADLVICCQDDTIWEQDWLPRLVSIHQTYGLYTCGLGDSFVSYTPHAVRYIGLWDPRFCIIAYHEADYFLRAAKHYQPLSSINDQGHARVLNPTEHVIQRPEVTELRTAVVGERLGYLEQARRIWEHKWGMIDPENWTPELLASIPDPLVPTYQIHPWFERGVLDLAGRGYVV